MKTTKKELRKIIVEIAVIIAVSTVTALLFNSSSPEGVPLIYTPKVIEDAGDEELFSDKNADTAGISAELHLPTEKAPDTVATVGAKNKKIKDSETTRSPKEDIAKSQNIESEKPENQDLGNGQTDETEVEETEEDTEEDSHTAGYKKVSYRQMKKIIDDNNFIILDARSAEDFNKAKIPGARNIYPYGDEGKVIETLFKLPTDKKYVVYCEGGNCDSSHYLAELMINAAGLQNVFLYPGGWDEWSKKEGL